MFSLRSPSPLAHRGADQVGRWEVQDAPGGESRELRHTDGHIFPCSSSVILSVDGVIADQLVNGTC